MRNITIFTVTAIMVLGVVQFVNRLQESSEEEWHGYGLVSQEECDKCTDEAAMQAGWDNLWSPSGIVNALSNTADMIINYDAYMGQNPPAQTSETPAETPKE